MNEAEQILELEKSRLLISHIFFNIRTQVMDAESDALAVIDSQIHKLEAEVDKKLKETYEQTKEATELRRVG